MLWIYHIWPLLCWVRLRLYLFLKSRYHKRVVKFVKSFFCIYWDYPLDFVFQFVNIVYDIDQFAYIEESLHPWPTSDLIILVIFLMWYCILFARILLRWFLHLCSSVSLVCYVLFLWYLFLTLVSRWLCCHRRSLEVFLPLHILGRVSER